MEDRSEANRKLTQGIDASLEKSLKRQSGRGGGELDIRDLAISFIDGANWVLNLMAGERGEWHEQGSDREVSEVQGEDSSHG